jgi:hypothetical protein
MTHRLKDCSLAVEDEELVKGEREAYSTKNEKYRRTDVARRLPGGLRPGDVNLREGEQRHPRSVEPASALTDQKVRHNGKRKAVPSTHSIG